MQLLVMANSILKQLITSEYHMRGYNKGGSNANGKTSIVDVSRKKTLCPKESLFSRKCHISDIDKFLFKNPSQDKLLPVTPSPLCI